MRRAAVLLLLALSGCGTPEPIEIVDAWVRAAPPGATATSAYLGIRNRSDAELTLESATAAGIDRVELHTTRIENGVMRMRRLGEVSIPAGGSVEFSPGARHLMLFSDTLPAEGEALELRLRFTDGSIVEFVAPVRRGD